MKVIYDHDRRVEGVIRKKGIETEVSERAGIEHIEAGIAKVAGESIPPVKFNLIKKPKGEKIDE